MLERQNRRRPIDIDFTLRRVFGKKSFRWVYFPHDLSCGRASWTHATFFVSSPLQREIVLAAIEGHDVFLQAATSFGKSLCFQLPAVVAHGGKRLDICVPWWNGS